MRGPNLHLFIKTSMAQLDSWWNDDRRNWCAYCGIPMRRRGGGPVQPATLATRDHVISKAHDGGIVTIPACRGCNVAKGTLSLQEFLQTDHFAKVRKNKHRNQWTASELWAVVGLAALARAAVLQSPTAAPKQPSAGSPITADHTR